MLFISGGARIIRKTYTTKHSSRRLTSPSSLRILKHPTELQKQDRLLQILSLYTLDPRFRPLQAKTQPPSGVSPYQVVWQESSSTPGIHAPHLSLISLVYFNYSLPSLLIIPLTRPYTLSLPFSFSSLHLISSSSFSFPSLRSLYLSY